MSELTTRWNAIQENIAQACATSHRLVSSIKVVAVSKQHSASEISEAFAVGLRNFGENRVEEAAEKFAQIPAEVKKEVTLHMIGQLQSRKAQQVVETFNWVHSVDRLEVAKRLSHFALLQQKQLQILLQVNISGEASKSGFMVNKWQFEQRQKEQFFTDVEKILALPNLKIEGLMTIAPETTDPETTRPIFYSTKILLTTLQQKFAGKIGKQLSMGMSNDYLVAIEEGATMVRIGRAIFGTNA